MLASDIVQLPSIFDVDVSFIHAVQALGFREDCADDTPEIVALPLHEQPLHVWVRVPDRVQELDQFAFILAHHASTSVPAVK